MKPWLAAFAASIASLLAAAAAAQPTPGAAPAPREVELAGGAVSVRAEFPAAPAGRRPAVIALLGNTRALTDAGFVAVTYKIHWEQLRQGEPTAAPADKAVGRWVLASPSAAVLGERYLRDVVAAATVHVPTVIDWMVAQPEIDAGRLAMVGGSTNGFIALGAAAADRRLRAVVAVAACGDFTLFLRGSSMGMAGAPLSLAPAYAEWIAAQQVVAHPERLVHAAVLMANRSGDPLIPIACADETARVLAAAYARAGAADRFHYERLAGEGHGLNEDEARLTLQWLQRWLGDDDSPAVRRSP